jgi:hypothetical protein
MQIHFVTGRKGFAKWRDIDALAAEDVDRLPQRFRSGIDVWIAQTYLLLKEPLRVAGVEARFGDRFPPRGLCIAHRDDLNKFTSGAQRAFVVAVRADRPPVCIGERVIVQNNVAPDTPRQRFLPLWPQPGLLPRDPNRGDRLGTMAYFGREGALPSWFRETRFVDALAQCGVRFEIRHDAWHDYRDVDLALAYRLESRSMLRVKPATKLANAWLAGVPALMGDEPAYRALRQSELDYVPVASADDVIAAVRALESDRARYRAMVDNGFRRGREFSVDATATRWLDFLLKDAIPAYAAWQAENGSIVGSLAGIARFQGGMAAQKLAARFFRRGLAFD